MITSNQNCTQIYTQTKYSPLFSMVLRIFNRGSSPHTRTSSEIPTTVPFPPCGENCTLVGISSLSGRIRCAGFRPDFEKKPLTPSRLFLTYYTTQRQKRKQMSHATAKYHTENHTECGVSPASPWPPTGSLCRAPEPF